MTVVAKMTSGKIVEIVRVADRVQFSDARGWICVVYDFHEIKRRQQSVTWIKSTTPFEWIRSFSFA